MSPPTLEQLKEEAIKTNGMKSTAARLRALYPLIESLTAYYSNESIRQTLQDAGLHVPSATGFKTTLYRARDSRSAAAYK